MLNREFNAVEGSASDQHTRYAAVAVCAFFGLVGFLFGLRLLCAGRRLAPTYSAAADWSYHPLPNG
jgi:hypothetical protein